MAKKLVEMSLLFDLYGGMLTERQRAIFDMYYNDDLSLAEIAENAGITRQGARDAVVHAEETLRACEEKLGLSARMEGFHTALQRMTRAAAEIHELNRRNYFDARVERLTQEIAQAAAAYLPAQDDT